jgi:ankyrin repeat protein
MKDMTDAIYSNDLESLRAQLKDPNAKDSMERRLLSVAAGAGKLEVIELLVKLGAQLDAQDGGDLGYTALITAARENQTAAVEKLLSLGASVSAGDSVKGTPLHHTGVSGAVEAAAVLLKAGAPVNAVDGMNTTPLTRVSMQANAAQWTAERSDGSSVPMEHPLYKKHLATAKLLLEKGANPNHIGYQGYSALHDAASHSAVALIELLVKAGANPSLPNPKKYTPLHAACDESRADSVKALIDAGADINAADEYGFTPMHGAAMKGATEAVRLLLKAGASLEPKALEAYEKVQVGMNPLDVAKAYGHTEMIKLMSEHKPAN